MIIPDSQYLGLGKYRIIVRRKDKLRRLRRLPEVMVDGERVIYPGWMAAAVAQIIRGRRRSREKRPEQEDMFDEL